MLNYQRVNSEKNSSRHHRPSSLKVPLKSLYDPSLCPDEISIWNKGAANCRGSLGEMGMFFWSIYIYIILYHIISYHIILYHIILYYIIIYYIILYYISLHYITLYYIILLYHVLYIIYLFGMSQAIWDVHLPVTQISNLLKNTKSRSSMTEKWFMVAVGKLQIYCLYSSEVLGVHYFLCTLW